jgi:ATP-binding cassette subfamily C protein
VIDLFFKIITSAIRLGGKEIFFVFFLIIFSTLIELLGISLIIPIISFFLDPTKIITYQNLIFFNFLKNLNSNYFVNFILIIFFFVFLIRYILTIAIEYFVVKYSKKWEIDLIIKLIDYHLSRSWTDTIKNQNFLIKNILTDIPSFINQGLTGILNIFKIFFILSGIVLYLIYLKGPVVILILFIITSIFYFFLKIFKNYLTKVSLKFSDGMDIKYNLTNEITKGFREIKIHNLKLFFLREYSNNENLLAKIDVAKKITSIIPKIIIELLCILTFLLIVFFRSDDPQDLIPLLGLLSFIVYRSQPLLASLASLFASLQIFSYQIKDAIIVIELSRKFNSINKNIELKKIYVTSGSVLEIKNLDFSYEDNYSKKVFSNLNLSLKFGKIYGFKGENGTGKSTLADLIIGLIKPQNGEILLNGKNVNLFSNIWMNSVSYLSQNFFLFNDTIKNNITLELKYKNSFVKEKYDRALKISNLINELDKFPHRDNSFLTSSGSNFSGGQKQRIAIARLIYRDSKIIILDEPTSSLDNNSSELMINMLKEIKKDKLIIIISHSAKILRECDEIYTINDKKLAAGEL